MNLKDFFYLVLGLVIIIGSIVLFFEKALVQENQAKILKINDISIVVEIANSPETRGKGLSGRDALPEFAGMLFIFDTPAQYKFWMKDMNFPLDIIWIDENFYITGIEKEISPETFPQTFSPDVPVKYVLELSAGFSDKYRINIGTMIQ